ncbi:MAG: TolC family protein [Bacteroidetes bacterium]|nr:TolC family protein [Bacteroidota bacterium]
MKFSVNLFLASFFVFLSFLLHSGLRAQKLWTLNDCITYAIENNLDIKKQLLNVKVNRANLLQSQLNLLPDLNAGATHVYNWGKTIDQYTNTFAVNEVRSNSFSIQSNLTVFDGLQKINTMRQKKIDLMATQYDLGVLENDISLAVAGFYLEILMNMELVEIAHNQADISKQQVRRVRQLVDAGAVARGDLLNIEAQATAEEMQVVENQNRLWISYLSLMQLIDLPLDTSFRIVKPQLRSVEDQRGILPPEAIYQYALGNRPEIQSAEMKLESARRSIAIARGSQYPIISVGGSWGTGYSGASKEVASSSLYMYPIGITRQTGDTVMGFDYLPTLRTKSFSDQLKDNENKTLGFYLSIPIFNGWQSRNAISQAKIYTDMAEHTLQQQKNTLRKSIEQAYTDALSAQKKHKAALSRVDAQEEAYKYAQQKFEVGMITAFDYNTSKKDLTQAQLELLQARYDFVFKTTILDFYMGKPISLN